MTDGIIKEVFDKHLSDNLGDYLLCKKIQRIQQELIEKIKQHCKKYNNANFIMIKKLIGDNQDVADDSSCVFVNHYLLIPLQTS